MSQRDLESTGVSFIIPSFKSRQTIAATLQSALAQETNTRFEVIVVESSQDSTAQWIEDSFPSIRVISSEIRLSPGAARNLGVERAKGQFLAFLDADTSAPTDWLQTVLDRMLTDPRIRVVSGAIEIGNPESIWARVLHWIEFSEFITGTPSGFKSHLSSSNLLIGREEFLKAGGFDESFVMSEDLLLSQVFRGSLFFESATFVHHYYRSSWREISDHLRKLGYWSGRLRLLTETSGSWVSQIPVASFILPPARTALIVSRVWRTSISEGLCATLYSAHIMGALFHWGLGFYQGLRGGR